MSTRVRSHQGRTRDADLRRLAETVSTMPGIVRTYVDEARRRAGLLLEGEGAAAALAELADVLEERGRVCGQCCRGIADRHVDLPTAA